MTDDGGADDGLKSMRAVWLSMPDEDPPERGFADLMAAARVKAEEMARPSLWERITATLRRPPVLALASVMVLVGGAVFIAQRKDTADLEVSPTRAPPAATSESVALERAETTTAAPRAASGSSAAADTSHGDMKKQEPAHPEVTAPAAGVANAPRAESKTEAKVGSKSTASSSAKLPAMPGLTKSAPTAMKAERARDFTKQSAPALALEDAIQQPAHKPGGGAVGGNSGSDAEESMLDSKTAPPPVTAPAAPAPPATSSQIHQRARAAAARGDCEGARTLSRQIATRDATYYKAKVETDPSLTNCIAR